LHHEWGVHPERGVVAPRADREDWHEPKRTPGTMEMHPTPKPLPAAANPNLEARMQALIKLRTQMEELHAHLEYLKLMLRLKDKRQG
jgi:hypothetical protein